ncbi:hypothetical protein [Haliangium sp.]|uniref:hypothetical protein n=1 Tax=Haliangium sp. TaxID=2663208 RepID=UPI003D0CD462
MSAPFASEVDARPERPPIPRVHFVPDADPGASPAPARAPESWREVLAGLFRGELFVFPATAASRALVAAARECLGQVVGPDAQPAAATATATADADAADAWRCPALSAAQVRAVRAALYARPELPARAARVVASLGFPARTRLDAPRLRVITAGAEREPAAAPVYVAHRDTWYGCAQAQVNWWMPVFDTPSEQAFVFYPDAFARAVANTSAGFDYERWMAAIGWHGEAPVEAYPQPTAAAYAELTRARERRFDFGAGDILLFAAAQLHQTRPNPIAGTSRLSVDIRTVIDPSSEDLAGPGAAGRWAAPNVDNASTGADTRVAREFAPGAG